MLTTSAHPAPSVLAIICALVFARPTARHNGGINGLQSVDCHHVAKKLLGQDIAKKRKKKSQPKNITTLNAQKVTKMRF